MTNKIIFTILFSATLSVTAASYDPTQALMRDFQSDEILMDSVKAHVKAGADVTAHAGIHWGNQTLLHYLALHNLPEDPAQRSKTIDELKDIAAYLIDNGANINTQDWWKQTPLSLAITQKNVPLALLFIEKGADITALPTLLNVATRLNLTDLILPLIQNGSDVNHQVDVTQETPLHDAIESNNIEIAQILLDNGANGRLEARYMGTPLHMAVKKGSNPEMIKLLLEYKTIKSSIKEK